MKNTNKKGFTIVELVIVIAVVAILAAVLIPTFVGIVKNANVSADTQLAKNLNTALVMYKAAGNKVETFPDALAAIRDAGYIVANLNPTSEGCYFVWEKNSNQILLVDSEWNVIYKTNEFLNDADSTINGGTWHVALSDPSVLEGVADVVAIPTLTDASVKGDGNVIQGLIKDGGTVVLNETVDVKIAPTHSDGKKKDGIRIDTEELTTMDLNGQTLNVEFETSDYRVFQVGSDFTLANGSLVAIGEAKKGGLWGVIRAFDDAEVTVKNMRINYTNTLTEVKSASVINTDDNGSCSVVIEDTVLSISNAVAVEISGVNTTGILRNVSIKNLGDDGWVNSAITVSNGGNVTIESGNYEAQGNVLHVFSSGGTINVKGGTFKGGIALDTGDSGCVADSVLVISGGTFTIGEKTYSHADMLKMNEAQLKSLVACDSVSVENGVIIFTRNQVVGQ